MTSVDLSTRTHVPPTPDERATLTQLLSYVRLAVHATCVGLSQADAVRTPLATSPAVSIGTWWRRPPGTTGASTSFASSPTA